ncbi:cobalt-zinc-cadmium efflux system protein [Novosphingobium sp. PhB165]|uniref:cation diffusion facilitator family transporter n=1 Tax=Novosphingobium sp. PhB165 TaxID=2485105 RepID=UPI001044F591|nr:cation diffusion facilitator family transporter [Novosphingobium sp. PhB165]TCM19488.1 cobalt-zinc-cadmium efflux system protein [Novosphingobium sp. PhB165]
MGVAHNHQGHNHGHQHHDHGHHHHGPGDGHGHGHSHGGHHHGHHHSLPSNIGRAFALAVGLNLIFVVAEVTAGFLSDSMALLADAGHNLSDVLSLLLAWAASVLASRPPTERFTYGLKSSSILAAIANAALLWVAIGAILVETIRRFAEPAPVAGTTMIVVAALGIAVNALSALLFAKGSKTDLNLRAAFVHLMADAAVSAGVVIAGLVIVWTGWSLVDPIASLVITAVIGWSSWSLLRESLRMGMMAVPESIDIGAVRGFLEARPGVERVHDLHVWPMSTTETALTAHLVMPEGQPGDAFLQQLAHDLEHDFRIGHPTIQIETEAECVCSLESESVV